MKEDEIRAFRGTFEAIETEISHSIIGQKDLIRQVLIAMVAGGNVLLEGMPGLGTVSYTHLPIPHLRNSYIPKKTLSQNDKPKPLCFWQRGFFMRTLFDRIN